MDSLANAGPHAGTIWRPKAPLNDPHAVRPLARALAAVAATPPPAPRRASGRRGA